MKKILVGVAVATLAWPALAWQINLEHLDRLGAKASNTVNVTLDAGLLQLAGKFLSDKDEDESAVKKLAAGLKSILVRSFEFKNDAAYLESDVEAIRNQLRGPDWKKIIEIRSKTEGNSDVYLRQNNDRITGFALIAAEPRELTVVTVEGNVDVDTFHKLAGNFGIPGSLRHKVEGRIR